MDSQNCDQINPTDTIRKSIYWDNNSNNYNSNIDPNNSRYKDPTYTDYIPYTGHSDPEEQYCEQSIADSSCYSNIRDDYFQQNNETFNRNQLLNHESYTINQLPSYYESVLSQSSIQNNTGHTQLDTEIGANATKQAIKRADVSTFVILKMVSSHVEFINRYKFTCIKRIEGKLCLCVDIAEYNSLKGNKLKEFTEMLEKNITIDNTNRTKRRKHEFKEDTKQYCPLKHKRVNFKKTESKRNRKSGQFSYSIECSEKVKQYKALNYEKAEIKEMLKVDRKIFRLKLEERCSFK